MQVDILTPESKLFSGEASSVIFPGISGDLKKGTIVLTSKEGKKNVEIEDGFVECIQNKVSVLIGGGSVN